MAPKFVSCLPFLRRDRVKMQKPCLGLFTVMACDTEIRGTGMALRIGVTRLWKTVRFSIAIYYVACF